MIAGTSALIFAAKRIQKIIHMSRGDCITPCNVVVITIGRLYAPDAPQTMFATMIA